MTTTIVNPAKMLILTDNGLIGDSRVIKQIRTARAAGYDVEVLGIGAGPTHQFEVAGAKVTIVHHPQPEEHRDRIAKSVGLLGYGQGERGSQRRQRAREKHRNLRVQSWKRRSGLIGASQQRTIKLESQWLEVFERTRTRIDLKAAEYSKRRREELKDTIVSRGETEIFNRLEVLDPSSYRLLATWGSLLDVTSPDVIHANDFRCLIPALYAREKAREAGRDIGLVYDAHEWVWGYDELGKHRLAAARLVEQQHIREFDHVVTVSDGIADLLVDQYSIPTPTVVQNTPEFPGEPVRGPSLRSRLRITADEFLAVYSGSIGLGRNLEICVEALVHLPREVVLGIVTGTPGSWRIASLMELANDLGVRDRVRLTGFVPQEQVSAYLAGADCGLIPFRNNPNNDVAVPTKTNEYAIAGVPLVVSSVPALSTFVRDTGIGEVHEVDDAPALAEAIKRVRQNPTSYNDGLDTLRGTHAWHHEAVGLRQAWLDAVSIGGNNAELTPRELTREPLRVSKDQKSVLIGPAAAGSVFGRLATMVPGMTLLDDDQRLGTSEGHTDPIEILTALADQYRYLLMPNGRSPVAGSGSMPERIRHIELAMQTGLQLGLLVTGDYAIAAPDSQNASNDERASSRRKFAARLHFLEFLGLPTFTTSRGLALALPGSTWFPFPLPADTLESQVQDRLPILLDARSKPEIARYPSVTSSLKSAARERGLRYRHLRSFDRDERNLVVAHSAVLIDSLTGQGYSPFAAYGMCGGSLVFGSYQSLGEDTEACQPMVATTVENLAAALEQTADTSTLAMDIRASGVAFAHRYHTIPAAVAVLNQFVSGVEPKSVGTE